MTIIHVNIHEHHSCQHPWASLMSININIHEHHSCQLALKTSFTELQLRKLHLWSSNFKASLQKLQLQSFICKASPTKLQCRVYKYRIRTTATSAYTWIQFEVSSQQTLLTKDLGDYTMYHILGFHNWASWKILRGLSPLFMYWGASPYSIKETPSLSLESTHYLCTKERALIL